MTVKSLIKKVVPSSFVIAYMNFLITRKYDVSIGKGSSVDASSFFEGHNAVGNHTEISGSRLGIGSYITHNSSIRLAKIGRFCCVGENVKIGVGQHPSNTFVSTHPAFYSLAKNIDVTFAKEQKFQDHAYLDSEKKYVVEVGNDVWIGSNALILDGIKIGDGAIVGAGAVVTKDVADYAIVGGVPAKLIRKRFSDEQIAFLKKMKWWEKDFNWIQNNYEIFSDIETFINTYKNESRV